MLAHTDAERMRRYRWRLKRGVAIVSVPIDAGVIDTLVRGGWLRNKEVHERAEIGAAIALALEHLPR